MPWIRSADSVPDSCKVSRLPDLEFDVRHRRVFSDQPGLKTLTTGRSVAKRAEARTDELCILRRQTFVHGSNADLVVSREIIPNAHKVMPRRAQKRDQRETRDEGSRGRFRLADRKSTRLNSS